MVSHFSFQIAFVRTNPKKNRHSRQPIQQPTEASIFIRIQVEREKIGKSEISFFPFFRGSAGSEVSGGPNGTVCWPKVTSGPSIGRTATPVRRKSQHHHPDLNQTNDKRRATHYLESDTDMLRVPLCLTSSRAEFVLFPNTKSSSSMGK